MEMKRKPFVPISLIGLAVVVSLGFPSGQRSGIPMAQRLQEISRDSDLVTNIFLNNRRVQMFETQLAEITDPIDRMTVRVNLAWERMLAGQPGRAVEDVDQVLEAIADWPIPQDAPVLKSLRDLRALSYLRLGEVQNCLASHNADSCLVPIRDEGVHRDQTGSRAAIREYLALLESEPENLSYRWLLNLAYMTVGEYPKEVLARWRIPPSVFESDFNLPPYRDMAPRLGVEGIGLAGGVIVEDFDKDGNLDILVSSWGLNDPISYYHNNGDGTFEDWSARAGLEGQVGGLNMVQADYDNDGFADVLVLRGGWLGSMGKGLGNHPNSLLRNRGDGTFEDVTEKSGLLSFHPTQTAAWADFDLDGDLDLFIGNESSGRDRHPCELFRNNGDGTFTEIAAQVGLGFEGFVKGVSWGDYNDDRYPDVYVSRFGEANLLFRNDSDGEGGRRFVERGKKAGVTEPLLSFPAWFWDYDNDGREDLLVASFSSYAEDTLATIVEDYLYGKKAEISRIYRNNGDGTFSDQTRALAFDAVLMAMGANFGDLDNDGFLDCYFGTGQPNMTTLIPNRMFRNDSGKRFQDVTTSGGFGHIQKGHGIAFADLDNDGDQDIYAVLGGAYSGDAYQNALFENPGNSNHWITLRLEGKDSNRSALGARIRVTARTAEGVRHIYATVNSGGSFGASSLQQEIGLGSALSIETVRIRWPNRMQTVQELHKVPMDRIVYIREGEQKAVQADPKPFRFSAKEVETPAAHSHPN